MPGTTACRSGLNSYTYSSRSARRLQILVAFAGLQGIASLVLPPARLSRQRCVKAQEHHGFVALEAALLHSVKRRSLDRNRGVQNECPSVLSWAVARDAPTVAPDLTSVVDALASRVMLDDRYG